MSAHGQQHPNSLQTKKPAEAGFFVGRTEHQPMCKPPLTEKSAPVA